jgi:hypothetical protein
MPAETDTRFDPLTEFSTAELSTAASESDLDTESAPQASDDSGSFEQGFRGVFRESRKWRA